MSDPIRRALRTFIQSFVGALLASNVLSAVAEQGVVDWSALKKAATAAAFAAIVAVLTYVQNAVEDKAGTALLVPKGPVPTPAEPAPVVLDPDPPKPAKKAPAKKAAAKKAAR
jgi:hypothetical protein